MGFFVCLFVVFVLFFFLGGEEGSLYDLLSGEICAIVFCEFDRKQTKEVKRKTCGTDTLC